MAFRHGQSAVVLMDEFDLSPFLNAATVTATMEPAECTNFASGCDRQYIKGLRDVTLALEGFHSASTAAGSTSSQVTNVFDDAFTGSTSPVFTVGLENDVVGRRAWLIKGDHVAYDIASPVDGIVTLSADIQGSQGYYGGVWLRDLTATTGASAAVNSGLTNGGTTGGGVAHLHVTSLISTSTTDAVFAVQHSTSGSTWATLLSFTGTTAATFQRSTVSGTIKEQLRAILVSNGSTLDTITAAVAFARYGPFKG